MRGKNLRYSKTRSGAGIQLGKRTDITSVLISEDIYTDSSKGNKPSDDMLTKAFKTNDTTKIAEIILKKGDLNCLPRRNVVR